MNREQWLPGHAHSFTNQLTERKVHFLSVKFNPDKRLCVNAAMASRILSDLDLRIQESMTKLARHQAGFAFLVAISFIVGYRPLVVTFALALNNDEYTHLLLILPVSVALIFLEWRTLRTTSP